MKDQSIHISQTNHTVVIRNALQKRWLYFQNPERVISIQSIDEVLPALREIDNIVSKDKYFAAGWIAYEAAPAFDQAMDVKEDNHFPLLWFGIYDSPKEIELTNHVKELHLTPQNWEPSISCAAYQRSIEKIKTYLKNGDTYQVNFTFRLRSFFRDDPWSYFKNLLHIQDAKYGGFINTDHWSVCSISPELFFQLNGEKLISRPMKGTAARGLTLQNDLEQAEALRQSKKNRAENVMIVDMVRNDMGRIADIGTVSVNDLFITEKYQTLWQMTSTVRAETKSSISEIVQALFPPASITGAPKIRTMEIIKEIETTPRHIYTGSIGFIAPNRQAQFNVAIRTLLIDKTRQEAEYGIGGGIVWDSIEQAELEECKIKAKVLVEEHPDFSLLESMLWTPVEGYFLLSYHLKRLKNSAEYFSYRLEIEKIKHMLNRFAQNLSPFPHKVRLLIAKDGTATLESKELNQSRYQNRKRVGIAKEPVNPMNPFLYHKTTHRRVYEQILTQNPGYEDVILWNDKEEITESCYANVIVESKGALWTPPIRCGLLDGTYRTYLLEKGEIQEKILTLCDLSICSHIYLINSVRKKQEVTIDMSNHNKQWIHNKERRTIWVPKEEKLSAWISTKSSKC
jgi:para-aminobenzoate synthetase/4-amino-4-deoxychorismate lyase